MNSEPAATYSGQQADGAGAISAAPRATRTLRQSKVAENGPDGRGVAVDRGQPPFDYQLVSTRSAPLLDRMIAAVLFAAITGLGGYR
jgi:hypothetical protein